MRQATRFGAIVGAALVIAAAAPIAARAATRVVTYQVEQRGDVARDFDRFVATAARVYADPRGWSLGGTVTFERVATAGDFILWLAAPSEMRSFGEGCSPLWSCRIGRDVVINDLRFRSGAAAWTGVLDEYRAQIINHETGHWIGLDHEPCGVAGSPAPVMMQQSMGLGECVGNAWPLQAERVAAARELDVAAPPSPLGGDFAPPAPHGYAPP
jgi:hypothetical protein